MLHKSAVTMIYGWGVGGGRRGGSFEEAVLCMCSTEHSVLTLVSEIWCYRNDHYYNYYF